MVAERYKDEQGISQEKRKSKTTVFEERLRLKTKGDLYHPNFLFYDIALGLGLTQQSFTTDGDSDKTSALLDDYSLLVQLLRMKPYPLTVYTNKSDDLIARRFLGSLRSEKESSGISLALRSEDWPMRFQYSTSETRQKSLAPTARDFFNRNEERFRYSVSRNFSELSHMSFEFDRDKVLQRNLGASIEIETNRYILLHNFVFGSDEQHRFDSFFSFLDQSGSFDFESLQWEERMKLQHTSNFLTNYDFRFTDYKQGTSRNKEIRGQAGFEHSLYESLVTTGNVFASSSDLDEQGELTQRGGMLGFSYRKKNPWGTLFSTYTTNLNQSDQSGGTGTGIVVDESHVFTDPVPITLDRVNINTSSIVVTDSSGLDIYTLGDDYTITEINGRIRLNVTTLGTPPNISDGQTLLVDYTFFVEPERQEDILRQNFTVRERFDKGLSLYYSHQRQDEKVSSSITEITPDEFSINTFGADYVKEGLALLAEYSKERSTQIPSTSKSIEARYSWPINADTRASVRASNNWLDLGAPDSRDITLFNAGGEIFSRLTEKYSISARIDYRDEDDTRFGKTEGFQLNSELQYNYRRLSVTTGVELNLLNRRDDKINSSFLYLRLRRFF
ncbi:MAG TPA: hypothetical protein ENH43_00780 [Phycisphaerales bacterium]|nr:hypothetical protein [Phycisphaerales bacterium]